ncbi:MAG: hypothetical protein GY894_06340 [Planctomycetes bacterium]|nr:hypothetical protein [Planctomycetota bacterium]MCP4838962.1 hypothetical protein [Planctomycetota bacterium]
MILGVLTLVVCGSATPGSGEWAVSELERLEIDRPEEGPPLCWSHAAFRSSALELIRGREAEHDGNQREAAVAYGEAILFDPTNETAWLGLAKIASQNRNRKLADKAWAKRLELCPRDVNALRATAELAFFQARYSDAVGLLLRHRAESPDLDEIERARLDAVIGTSLAEIGEVESATAIHGQAEEQLRLLANTIAVDHSTRREWEWLIRQLAAVKSTDLALVAARARLESGKLAMSADRGRMTSMCIVLNALARDAAATTELIESLPSDDLRLRLEFRAPLSPAMMRYRASTIHATLGDRSGAIDLLNDAVHLDPDVPGVLNNLGYMLLEQDPNSVDAARYLERALELDSEDAGTLDSVGYLRLLQSRIQDGPQGRGALSLLRDATRRTDHMDPIILLHLGDAEQAAGLDQAARSTWRHALALMEHPEFQAERTRSYDGVQGEDWGIHVVPSADLYHLEFGDVATALRQRLAEQTLED